MAAQKLSVFVFIQIEAAGFGLVLRIEIIEFTILAAAGGYLGRDLFLVLIHGIDSFPKSSSLYLQTGKLSMPSAEFLRNYAFFRKFLNETSY
jgi:hypothetical protein